jgi:Tfp pilus assembly protein PilX
MMSKPLSMRSRQRGATLIIGLILLVLISLIVVNAVTLSSSNLKAVGNMQARNESVAAANQAIEKFVSSSFTTAVGTRTFNVDINNDATNDYAVVLPQPTCLGWKQAGVAAPSDVEMPVSMQFAAQYQTDWDIQANVTDTATGASVEVHEGVRKRLSQSEKDAVCP